MISQHAFQVKFNDWPQDCATHAIVSPSLTGYRNTMTRQILFCLALLLPAGSAEATRVAYAVPTAPPKELLVVPIDRMTDTMPLPLAPICGAAMSDGVPETARRALHETFCAGTAPATPEPRQSPPSQ